jgi:hypothetical protein
LNLLDLADDLRAVSEKEEAILNYIVHERSLVLLRPNKEYAEDDEEKGAHSQGDENLFSDAQGEDGHFHCGISLANEYKFSLGHLHKSIFTTTNTPLRRGCTEEGVVIDFYLNDQPRRARMR